MQILPINQQLALVGLELSGNQAQQGSLATPGRPHDTCYLSARNTQVDSFEDGTCTPPESDAPQFNGAIGICSHVLPGSPSTPAPADVHKRVNGTTVPNTAKVLPANSVLPAFIAPRPGTEPNDTISGQRF